MQEFTEMQKINLVAGENTIKISTEQGIWFMDAFEIYYPGVQFYNEETDSEPTYEVNEGSLCAKILFGGLMVNEEIDCYMAVYEIDSDGIRRLVGIDMDTITVTEKSNLTFNVTGIEKKENCTYLYLP